MTQAFPGAYGWGAEATGGRGGTVVYVTNLNDSGAGSYRAALQDASDPKIIVFSVGGIIDIQSMLPSPGDNVTIAGQTAPGGGITI